MFGSAQVALAAAPAGIAATTACSCWSSSRAATTGSTRSCPTPIPRTTRCARRSRSRATTSCSCPIAPACIRRSRRSAALERRQLAVLQGVGYPEPNLSHFRSIEIWDTASKSDEYLQDGWLTRAFAAQPVPRVVRRRRRDHRLQRSGSARRRRHARDRARQHRAVPAPREARAAGAPTRQQGARAHPQGRGATSCRPRRISTHATTFATEFPAGDFGNAIRTACQVIANPSGVAVVRVTLSGFDTHANQAGTQARLLSEVAQRPRGAARSALVELGKWNEHAGADLCRVRPPAEGEPDPAAPTTARPTCTSRWAAASPAASTARHRTLSRLSGDGNPAYALDFRSVYATVLERWWGVDSRGAYSGADSRRCRSSRPDGRVSEQHAVR